MSTTSIYGDNLEGLTETARIHDRRIWTQAEGFLQSVAFGRIPGHEIIHKFGSNVAVSTTLSVVASGGIYQTPTAPVTLYATSTSANDSAAGSGAQQIIVEYLDTSWNRQVGTIEMNGLSQSTSSISGVMRVFRAKVARSGSYANATTPSQQGTITIHENGGSPVYATLPELSSGFGSGQSLIAVYTVPANHTAFVLKFIVSAASNQTTDVYFFSRSNADDVTAPYGGVMRAANVYSGLNSTVGLEHLTWEQYPEKTDMGFMAKVSSGNGSCSAEFEFMLINNDYLGF